MSVNLFGMFQESKRPSDLNADDATAAVYDLPASAFPYKTSTGIWGGNEAYGDANPIPISASCGWMPSCRKSSTSCSMA